MDKFEEVVRSQRRYTAKARELQDKIIEQHRAQVAQNKKRLGNERKPIDFNKTK